MGRICHGDCCSSFAAVYGLTMIGEIAAIVAGVNAATSAIKLVAETTNDISSISSFLSTLGGAEVELQRAQNEGKLSEADAV